MRQRALTPDQIGMGQEEVMAKEDEKSASEAKKDLQETTEEEKIDSEAKALPEPTRRDTLRYFLLQPNKALTSC
jgi:hypothetical protein